MTTSNISGIEATELLYRKVRYTGYLLPVDNYIIAIEQTWNDETSTNNFDAHIFAYEEDPQFVIHKTSSLEEDDTLFETENAAGQWAVDKINELKG